MRPGSARHPRGSLYVAASRVATSASHAARQLESRPPLVVRGACPSSHRCSSHLRAPIQCARRSCVPRGARRGFRPLGSRRVPCRGNEAGRRTSDATVAGVVRAFGLCCDGFASRMAGTVHPARPSCHVPGERSAVSSNRKGRNPGDRFPRQRLAVVVLGRCPLNPHRIVAAPSPGGGIRTAGSFATQVERGRSVPPE